MKAISRRLQRLEQRFGQVIESGETRHLLARLEAARLRHGLPEISSQRKDEWRGMTIIQILHSGRARNCEPSKQRELGIHRGEEAPGDRRGKV